MELLQLKPLILLLEIQLGDLLFSLLVNESHDHSRKKQMDIVLRYVDKRVCN